MMIALVSISIIAKMATVSNISIVEKYNVLTHRLSKYYLNKLSD